LKRRIRGPGLAISICCLLLSAIPGRFASGRLKLAFQSPVMKVFQDEQSPGTSATEEVSMARGECQSLRLLVSAQGKDLRDGFEDAKLLPMLNARGKKAEGRQIAACVARSPRDCTSDPAAIEAAHLAMPKVFARTNAN
jgi:hypothetical protein